MDDDWISIYLYVAGKTYNRWHKNGMPDDIRVDLLNDRQLADLNRLKDWLCYQRATARHEKERAERRREKEQEIAKRKVEQPSSTYCHEASSTSVVPLRQKGRKTRRIGRRYG
jgi:hypothetical protein